MVQTLPADALTADTIPKSVGPYRVHAVLGRGGNGVVYRAIAPNGADVAVKTVHLGSEWGLGSLRAEIHALRRVQHDNVVRVFDEGVEGGRPWFAMERVEGEPLGVFLAGVTEGSGSPRSWTPERLGPVLNLFARISQALAVVHEAGIVHRDLKPENVLVRSDWRPVIVDFGLAVTRLPTTTRAVADAASIAGTFAYMAPEQLRGETVDARADLYALGCMLFEILTGALPVSVGGARPSDFAHGIPPTIDALVLSLLAQRPRDRLAHADDVAASVAAVSVGPDSATPLVSLRAWLYRPALSGRADAIARVAPGLELLRRGRGSFIVLLGETGIGKTHIAMEVARRVASEATILTATSEPPSAAPTPLSCWNGLFDAAADRTRIRPSSSIARAVVQHLPVLAALHPRFDALLRVPGSSADYRPTLDEIFVTLRDLIAGFASERPVVILLDDVQWADEVTLGALKLLVASALRERPVFFLATCRDDELSVASEELLASPHVERIAVGPLPDQDLRELVTDMLGVGEPPEPVVGWIAARAEGNPFLAAEYLRLVVSEVPMVRELELPRVRVLPPPAGLLESLPTPSSVQEIAGRRLGLLDRTSRHVAELMALMGGSLDAPVFAHVLDRAVARDAVADLEERQLVVRTPEGGARLLHDRLRVAAVVGLSADGKRSLHREAAGLLAASPEPPHGAIAHHWMEAGASREALPHLERAGEQALARAAYETAARHFDDVRRVAADLARQGATFEPLRRARWEHGAARAHFGRGDLVTAEERVRDALAVASVGVPRTKVGWAAMAAHELAASAIGWAAPGDRALLKELSSAASLLPQRYFYDEDMLPVLSASLLSANLARRARAGPLAGPSSHLGAMAGLFRLQRVAQSYFDAASAGASSLEAWRDVSQALMVESFYHAGSGDLASAERAAERAAEACGKTSDPWMLESVETTRSHVEFFMARFGEARARAERVAALARERQNEQHEIWGLYLQARSDIPLGHFARARLLLERALEKLTARSEPISQIACTGMLAEACLGEGDRERAVSTALAFLELVAQRVPSAYPTLVGYTGAARVLCMLVEERSPPDLWRAARRISAALWRFASVFPIARPAAYLYTAQVLRSRGLRAAAHHLFSRGAERARKWNMPYEQARLLEGAAQSAATPERAAATAASAQAIFGRIGVASHDSALR